MPKMQHKMQVRHLGVETGAAASAAVEARIRPSGSWLYSLKLVTLFWRRLLVSESANEWAEGRAMTKMFYFGQNVGPRVAFS